MQSSSHGLRPEPTRRGSTPTDPKPPEPGVTWPGSAHDWRALTVLQEALERDLPWNRKFESIP